jgi:hypothetical protein
MRGRFRDQGELFSYLSPESRVPAEHLLRRVRQLIRDVLTELSPSLGPLYARDGRPSIPPEGLLSGLLLQVFYRVVAWIEEPGGVFLPAFGYQAIRTETGMPSLVIRLRTLHPIFASVR